MSSIGPRLREEHIAEFMSTARVFETLPANSNRFSVIDSWRQAALTAFDAWIDIARAWKDSRQGRTSESVEGDQPETARCDGSLMVEINNFFRFTGGPVTKHWVKNFGFTVVQPKSVKGLHTEVDHTVLRRVDPIENEPVPNSFRDPLSCSISARMRHVPASRSSTPQATLDDVDEGMQRLGIDGETLLRPLRITPLICEFKPTLPNAEKSGIGQARLDVVATVKFLAMLDIVDFPVFGLVTEGPVGYVMMAWGESMEETESQGPETPGESDGERKDIVCYINDHSSLRL